MSGMEGTNSIEINLKSGSADFAIDHDLNTYTSLAIGETIAVKCITKPKLYIDRICFVSGDRKGSGKIKRIVIESKRDNFRWEYQLINTSKYQEIKFPTAIWLSRNSDFTITPVDSFESDLIRISEISFYGE